MNSTGSLTDTRTDKHVADDILTDEEIKEAVKKLSNDKAAGHDLVINEHIFTTISVL